MQPLSNEAVLAATGFDPRWARVLASVDLGRAGFALVDSNGEGGPGLEACALHRTADGSWQDGSSMAGDGAGYLDDVVFDSGEGEPGSTVTVRYKGELTVVTVGANGWWTFAAIRDEDCDALPECVEQEQTRRRKTPAGQVSH